MVRSQRVGRWCCVLSATALVAWCGGLMAFDRAKPVGPATETVDLFPALAARQIEVQLIPKDSAECNLLVTNKTGKPLSVRLPQAFAGVPVLAQFAPPTPRGRGSKKSDVPQTVGIPGMNNNNRNGVMNVPMNGPMNANQGNARGQQQNLGGFWNLAPETVGKFKLPAVCLSHGAPNPRPQIPYQIKPLESVTDKAGVAEVCAMLGHDGVGQKIVQLAAWHLANDVSWEELAATRQKALIGTAPTYSRQEIQAAQKLAEKAVDQAKRSGKSGPSASPGASASTQAASSMAAVAATR